MKCRRLVGQIYREFYAWTDSTTLRHLYITYVRPHLEYASPLWDPHCKYLIDMLESVQRFACRIILKQWELHYDMMLTELDLPSLTLRRRISKLTILYKVINGDTFFSPECFNQTSSNYSLRSYSTLHYQQCRTNYLLNSLVPYVTSLRNSLPHHIKTAPTILAYKHLLYKFLRPC